MSHTLSQLLGVSLHAASSATGKLEELSGYPAEDNRLFSEIKMSLRHKIAELGLDPDDTTLEEFYHAAVARFGSDSWNFSRALSPDSNQRSDKHVRHLIQLAGLCDIPREVWVLKRSAAKSLLRKQPPRRLLKVLHSRSADSVLKREDIDQLYAGLSYVESPNWRKNFYHQHVGLMPSDFEIREIRFVNMTRGRMGNIKTKRSVTIVPQLGVVALWPAAESSHHAVRSFLEVLRAINQLKLYSLAAMASQMSSNFGRQLAGNLENGLRPPAKIGHLPVSWQTLQHFYGALPNHQSSLLGPGFEQISLSRINASKILAGLHPSFRWWSDSEFLAALAAGGPVSLNVSDAAENFRQQAPYKQRTGGHLQASLWDELMARYLQHPAVESFILKQLDEGQQFLNSFGNQLGARLQPELQIIKGG